MSRFQGVKPGFVTTRQFSLAAFKEGGYVKISLMTHLLKKQSPRACKERPIFSTTAWAAMIYSLGSFEKLDLTTPTILGLGAMRVTG
jgi:hypothetical protein